MCKPIIKVGPRFPFQVIAISFQSYIMLPILDDLVGLVLGLMCSKVGLFRMVRMLAMDGIGEGIGDNISRSWHKFTTNHVTNTWQNNGYIQSPYSQNMAKSCAHKYFFFYVKSHIQ